MKILFTSLGLIFLLFSCDYLEEKNRERAEELTRIKKSLREKKDLEDHSKVKVTDEFCSTPKIVSHRDTISSQLKQPIIKYKTYIYKDKLNTTLSKKINLELRFRYVKEKKELIVYNNKNNTVLNVHKDIVIIRFRMKTYDCIDGKLALNPTESSSEPLYINKSDKVILSVSTSVNRIYNQENYTYESEYNPKSGVYYTTENKQEVDDFLTNKNLGRAFGKTYID